MTAASVREASLAEVRLGSFGDLTGDLDHGRLGRSQDLAHNGRQLDDGVVAVPAHAVGREEIGEASGECRRRLADRIARGGHDSTFY